MLQNYQNYGPYVDLVKTGECIIDPSSITQENWNKYFFGILNILRDGIETDVVQQSLIDVYFDNIQIKLSIPDYFFNILFWKLFIDINKPITSKYVFFDENITRDSIKNYIDDFFIKPNRTTLDNVKMNNIISDALYNFRYIDEFSMYFANTINIEDNIILMNNNEEFNSIIHCDLSNVPLEDIKNVGLDLTHKMVDIIKNSDHCLSNSFRAKEGINVKQYREFAVNIGTKPDGKGGVFPYPINSNYLTGGLLNLNDYFVESSSGRTAQILSKSNVGSSGYFARLLGLNNHDTILHHDPDYICDSKNFQEVDIKNEKIFTKIATLGRWYRLSPNGIEYKMNIKDRHLIGNKIYMRSPMTCSSMSRGEGICYRCYSELAYTNNVVNVGKLSAEILSEQLTQKLLSAKHLLESVIKKINWNNEFGEYFVVNGDTIQIDIDGKFSKCKLLIDPESITAEEEYDDFEYNEYVTEFYVQTPKGDIIPMGSRTDNPNDSGDNMYISIELNEIIRKKAYPEEGMISINMEDLVDLPLFLIVIQNNELTKSLESLKNIMNKNDNIKRMNRHSFLQSFLETAIEGGVNINSIHCEVLLANQLRNVDDILESPDWTNTDEPSQLLTLNQALTNNPRIITSLSYEKISKALYSPLTFKKTKPSFVDVFFMEQPQKYLSKEVLSTKRKRKTLISPFKIGGENK